MAELNLANKEKERALSSNIQNRASLDFGSSVQQLLDK